MSDILIIKCNYEISNKDYDNLRKGFLYQKSTGVVLLPPGFEAIVVPDDVEIKVVGANESLEKKDICMSPAEIVEDIIKTIERELHNSNSDSVYCCEEGKLIDANSGYVGDWFSEYKDILRKRYCEKEKEK